MAQQETSSHLGVAVILAVTGFFILLMGIFINDTLSPMPDKNDLVKSCITSGEFEAEGYQFSCKLKPQSQSQHDSVNPRDAIDSLHPISRAQNSVSIQ